MESNIVSKLSTTYSVDCYDKNGFLKWTESTPNIVVDEGVSYLFDTAFLNGEPEKWYAGLVKSGTGVPEDTMVNHTFAEWLGWVNVYRPLLTFEPVIPRTSLENIKSREVVFVSGTTDTITGAYMTTRQGKDDIDGKLYGVTSFRKAHDLIPGDSIAMTIIIGARQ